jgi:hypothetical protein
MGNPLMPATQHTTQETTSSLLGDVLQRVTELLRLEFDLARSEVARNLNRAAVAVGLVVAAVVLTLSALNVLSAAAVAALTEAGLEGYWASLIVAGALALFALVFAMKGIRDLRLSSIVPNRAAREMREDAALLREVYND